MARKGEDFEFSLDDTIKSTAKNAGILELEYIREKLNDINLIVFFDVGGSMDPFVKLCEELFSAAKSEFKNLEYYYFTIVSMSLFGLTTIEGMKIELKHKLFSTNLPRIIR
ncbi:MAG: hypothetical protein Ct9H90mP19_2620 [Gammaproteobacteria bacterium]|nr:MAG: hypothetical protein Ct9H90mP19_2620 [Gammaproteobacteria bacterium]